jgi:pimeloyl-ACP methyl ester carboxylesterase
VVFLPILRALGTDRVVAAGDTPGFGESDEPPIAPEIEDYARAHGDAIDALELGRSVDLFGYYTGGKIAIALALQRPDQIRRVVLFGAPIYTPEEVGGERRTYQRDVYRWDASHLLDWWEHLRVQAPPDMPIDLFVRYFAEIQRGGPNSWWGHRAAFQFDLAEHLPKLGQPAMVLCTMDPQGEKSRRALQYLKRGQFIEMPYIGQGLLDLHTDEVADHLRSFLDTD